MLEWQPIETAPKDETPVLVYAESGMFVVRWLNRQNYNEGWWHIDDNRYGPFAVRGPLPTHWMPLPEPPKEGMP